MGWGTGWVGKGTFPDSIAEEAFEGSFGAGEIAGVAAASSAVAPLGAGTIHSFLFVAGRFDRLVWW